MPQSYVYEIVCGAFLPDPAWSERHLSNPRVQAARSALPHLGLSPISVALGPMRESDARRLATRMAGQATDLSANYPEGSERALVRDATIATLATLDFDPFAFEDGKLL